MLYFLYAFLCLVGIFKESICKFALPEVKEDMFVLQNQNQIQLSNVRYLIIWKKKLVNLILFYLIPKKKQLFRTLILELFNILQTRWDDTDRLLPAILSRLQSNASESRTWTPVSWFVYD